MAELSPPRAWHPLPPVGLLVLPERARLPCSVSGHFEANLKSQRNYRLIYK